jgi:putative ABC transport system ATP-binding protein
MPELQTDTYQDLDPQVLSKPVVVGLEEVTKVYGMATWKFAP